MGMAEGERTELLALLRTLTPAQWQAQSLCTDWRVQDVATHVVSYDELSKPALAGAFLRGGGSFAKVNAVALRRYESLEPEEIVDLLARNLRPRGLPSGFGGGIALTDGTNHHQDIRRALGLPRTTAPGTAREGPRLRTRPDPACEEERLSHSRSWFATRRAVSREDLETQDRLRPASCNREIDRFDRVHLRMLRSSRDLPRPGASARSLEARTRPAVLRRGTSGPPDMDAGPGAARSNVSVIMGLQRWCRR